jgi:hypothetical protein
MQECVSAFAEGYRLRGPIPIPVVDGNGRLVGLSQLRCSGMGVYPRLMSRLAQTLHFITLWCQWCCN